ncbi:MAG: sulfate adenylyltransferase [Dehalococcoidia bacterium]|nr:sulfate adenylyltransferase [Dehalococcoidia bacterium]
MVVKASATPSLSAPHGGKLVQRLLEGQAAAALRAEAPGLPSLTLSARELSDAQLIAQGAFSPLEGFLGSADYKSVVKDMRLASGAVWSVPVTLSIPTEKRSAFRASGRVALKDPQGALVGALDLQEVYEYDKRAEARLVYRTEEEKHAGVANLYAQGDLLLGGKISLLGPLAPPQGYEAFFMSPAQSRQLFQQKGWRTVVGFQTRNPVHRAHEYIQKCAMEIVDGLLLHPLVGDTKGDDIPGSIRMECYQVLLEKYYPASRVTLAIYPAFMRYAGPREAVFHAMARKNYGCTHFIVGRDHAGVGRYYGTYDAQHIFQEFTSQELGIQPLFFDNSFYCTACAGMATEKTCPHDASKRLSLSGTQVRDLLSKGEKLPPEMSRPEVAEVLRKAYTAG